MSTITVQSIGDIFMEMKNGNYYVARFENMKWFGVGKNYTRSGTNATEVSDPMTYTQANVVYSQALLIFG